MAEPSIAAQMYTLRDHVKTLQDATASLQRVKAIGYDAVQLSAMEHLDAGAVRDILQHEGLTVCAMHTSYVRLRDDLDAVLDDLRTFECRYIAPGSMPPDYRNAEGYHRFAREASDIAHRLAEAGVIFGYHNHAFELEHFDGKMGLAILYEESDPEVFTSEIDTYWIQYGGGNPGWWLRQLKGRAPLVHLKDMSIVENQQVMAEVGEGNLDWPDILAACREAGVLWYIVEQDFCRRDPFESLAISLHNLQAMGVA
jgi:sugar phosphate isomerase/epimerase